MTEQITILITDDHALVRNGVRMFLELQPDLLVLGEADSGEEAVRMAADLVPDVVLMDLVMAGMGGVEATRRVKQVSPHSQIIVLTSYHEDEYIFPALRAGAQGYILKSQPGVVVISQLRRIEMGEPALSPSIALRVLRHFHATPARIDTTRSSGLDGGPPKQLTDREIDVLRLIAKGYKAPEVAPLLGITAHTVSSYVRDIYRKLGISSRAEAAMEAAKRGLVT